MAAALPGQWGYYMRQQRQMSQERQSTWAPPPQWASPLSPQSVQTAVPPPYRPGFQGLLSTAPMYNTFPSYPKGYGPPPMVEGFLPEVAPDPSAKPWTPPALPEDRRGVWPSWIETAIPELERHTSPERAALARTADRVWFLAPDDTAFIPLAFWDKFRIVESGSFVEVRNKGEFQIAFHDGAWVRSIGAIRLGLPKLSAALLELQVTDVRRLWIQATTRPMRVLLPDGSRVELAGTEVYLEREGPRLALFNHGPRAVRWVGRVGEREIAPAHRIELFVSGVEQPFLAAELQLEGAVRAAPAGRDVEVHGEAGGGAVIWSGTRIRVDSGAVLRLDPLAGKTFPENPR